MKQIFCWGLFTICTLFYFLFHITISIDCWLFSCCTSMLCAICSGRSCVDCLCCFGNALLSRTYTFHSISISILFFFLPSCPSYSAPPQYLMGLDSMSSRMAYTHRTHCRATCSTNWTCEIVLFEAQHRIEVCHGSANKYWLKIADGTVCI